MSVYEVTWTQNGITKREEFGSRAEAIAFRAWVVSDSKPKMKKVAE